MSSVPREALLRSVRVSGVCVSGVCVSGVSELRGLPVSGVDRFGSVGMSGVARLRSLRSGGVALCGVRASSVQRFSSVRSCSALALPEGRLHQSPREVLRATMHELRRAAEANRFSRIARRLAGLAEGKKERVAWSSRKSLRGAC